MRYYFTVGTGHVGFPGCVVIDADDIYKARNKIAEILGRKWCMCYDNMDDMHADDRFIIGINCVDYLRLAKRLETTGGMLIRWWLIEGTADRVVLRHTLILPPFVSLDVGAFILHLTEFLEEYFGGKVSLEGNTVTITKVCNEEASS